MEAKDTVIAPDQVLKIAQENGLQGSAEAQAEISFKAGIREVVEWIETHEKSTCMDCTCAFNFRADEWQAKLEDWIDMVFNKMEVKDES